jgi:hypothetical protein
MVADFRRRFWISLALTVPILAISEHFWALVGLRPQGSSSRTAASGRL